MNLSAPVRVLLVASLLGSLFGIGYSLAAVPFIFEVYRDGLRPEIEFDLKGTLLTVVQLGVPTATLFLLPRHPGVGGTRFGYIAKIAAIVALAVLLLAMGTLAFSGFLSESESFSE